MSLTTVLRDCTLVLFRSLTTVLRDCIRVQCTHVLYSTCVLLIGHGLIFIITQVIFITDTIIVAIMVIVTLINERDLYKLKDNHKFIIN